MSLFSVFVLLVTASCVFGAISLQKDDVGKEVPRQGALLSGVNAFLTLPVAPVALVLIGSLGTQASAVLVTDMLTSIGAPAVSGVRMAIAALMMFVLFRPSLAGMTSQRAINIAVYGIAIAMMNVMVFQAVARLPQGVAMTIDFMGPCVVSFLGLKVCRSRLWAFAAFAGVMLIARPSNNLDPVGVAFGVTGAVFFALYTVFSARVGQAAGGLKDLTFSVAIAAVILLPFSVPAVPLFDGSMWATIAISGLIGAVVPFAVDTIAGGITSAAVVGTLFALDPVIGAILGRAFSGDELTGSMVCGIFLIVVAGAVITWRSGKEDGLAIEQG